MIDIVGFEPCWNGIFPAQGYLVLVCWARPRAFLDRTFSFGPIDTHFYFFSGCMWAASRCSDTHLGSPWLLSDCFLCLVVVEQFSFSLGTEKLPKCAKSRIQAARATPWESDEILREALLGGRIHLRSGMISFCNTTDGNVVFWTERHRAVVVAISVFLA